MMSPCDIPVLFPTGGNRENSGTLCSFQRRDLGPFNVQCRHLHRHGLLAWLASSKMSGRITRLTETEFRLSFMRTDRFLACPSDTRINNRLSHLPWSNPDIRLRLSTRQPDSPHHQPERGCL
jgi:hypothetical protein